jgi:hypothetical protein
MAKGFSLPSLAGIGEIFMHRHCGPPLAEKQSVLIALLLGVNT